MQIEGAAWFVENIYNSQQRQSAKTQEAVVLIHVKAITLSQL